MPAVKWTKEQESAIQARDCSLLVAAAAGSGKTAVLVERIIQRILDPETGVDIDRLVIVTFTDAAASEMRERIEKAISDRITGLTEQDSPAFRRRLKRQLTLLSKASITTMHAFCAKLIRSNFNKLDLDPDFRILDAIEADIVKAEILDKVLEEMYEEESENQEIFETLAEVYNTPGNDEGLKALIQTVYRFTGSCPFPQQWLTEQLYQCSPEGLARYQGAFQETIWGSFICRKLQAESREILRRCRQGIQLSEENGLNKHTEYFHRYYTFFQGLTEQVEQKASWDELSMRFHLFEQSRMPVKPKDCAEAVTEQIHSIAEEIKDTLKLYTESLFSRDSAQQLEDILRTYPLLQGICELVRRFSLQYSARKRAKKMVDYDDLEHLSLQLLTENPEIGIDLREYYEEVYTDEYQDTNLTQETILSLISRQPPEIPNLFMVGDIKQSIYGFRQARPDIFLDKYNRFSKNAVEDTQQVIRLYKNFRSRKDVIGSVNLIFSAIMSEQSCGMDYSRKEYLFYGANYQEAKWDVSCELLLTDSDTKTEELYADRRKTEFEAAMVADRIRQLTEDPQVPVRYKDIVILMRATKNRAEVYKDVLDGFGIPAYCDVNSGFYQSREIRFLLSFLQIIDNPLQDIPLLAVLKSPVGGFTENDIADLRLVNKETELYQNLNVMAEAEDGEGKASAFLQKLSDFREAAVELSLPDLILQLYRETDYYNYAGVFPDGQQRQGNLRKLYQEAVIFEEQSGGGIFSFLQYVERIRDSSGDLGGAAILGENDDVVRIMSIHKSKGLEFPVVFLVSMDKGFNRRDFTESVLMHQELGFGADCFDIEQRVKYETATKTVMKLKMNQEMVAEEMRLLYVAMTRAKEKLILTGTLSDIGKQMDKYQAAYSPDMGKVPSSYLLKARNYFDLVMPVLLRHPDLAALRDRTSVEWREADLIRMEDDEACRFQVHIYDKNLLFAQMQPAETQETAVPPPVQNRGKEADIYQEVVRRLSYVYPYESAAELPVKISVSELRGMHQGPQTVREPAFLDGKRTKSAAELGTITHYILQHMDFHHVTEDAIENLCRRQGLLPHEIQRFHKQSIFDFVQSEIGQRLRAAEQVFREIPFTMKMQASEVYGEVAEALEEEILIQGIADCFFIEDGEIVLLDYKTDHIGAEEVGTAAAKYQMQLDVYAKALEAELGLPVKEKLVYFLSIGAVARL